jgi:ribonuclease VapC
MIALDTSALLAIAVREPEAARFAKIVADNDCLMGAPTLFEMIIVAKSKSSVHQLNDLRRILSLPNVTIVDFTANHVTVAELAFERFGKGNRHPARLNFGDCMAYAIARLANVPLLFKGNDFTHTDIAAVHAP